jgi:hypothetical protein
MSASVGPSDSLELRFTRFLEGLPGAEAIDRMALPDDPQRRRKADYLLEGRKVIVELKTLTDDPSPKVEATADKHRHRDDWPMFYGTADVRKVLTNLPDGEAIYAKMVNALGRSVEAAVRSAEEQVTHTRHVLGLSDAAGMLVILNDSIDILDPYVVGHRVAHLMRRSRTGNSEAGKLDFVWLLFESHVMGTVHGRPAVPCILINSEGKDRFPWFERFHHDLVRRWAHANGGISVAGDAPDPSKIKFTPMKEATAAPPQQLPRHEWWRRQYHAQPYLRPLSDAELLVKGADILRRLMPHFLDGGPGYVPEVVNPSMEEFTHFIEEMNHRGIDMRRIPKH